MIINKHYLDELQRIYSESKKENECNSNKVQSVSTLDWWNTRGIIMQDLRLTVIENQLLNKKIN